MLQLLFNVSILTPMPSAEMLANYFAVSGICTALTEASTSQGLWPADLHINAFAFASTVRLRLPGHAQQRAPPLLDTTPNQRRLHLIRIKPIYESHRTNLGLGSFTFIVSGVSDRKSTRLNSSHSGESRMPSSA